jgi:hypothetical protein
MDINSMGILSFERVVMKFVPATVGFLRVLAASGGGPVPGVRPLTIKAKTKEGLAHGDEFFWRMGRRRLVGWRRIQVRGQSGPGVGFRKGGDTFSTNVTALTHSVAEIRIPVWWLKFYSI